MGAFLPSPKTEKTLQNGNGPGGIKYGVGAMQGWRVGMEDAHQVDTKGELGTDISFFGVFDGHAGPKVASESAKNLLTHIGKFEDLKDDKVIKQKMTDGFLNLDKELHEIEGDRSGSTAVVCAITPTKIIFSNCGDSRGLLCRSGALEFATEDHKPYVDGEKSRIEHAGGTVLMQRVNGSLAVSRALGDFDFKRSNDLGATLQMVSPEPDTTVIERSPEDHFVLLACDGIYDVMENEAVIIFVEERLKFERDISKICCDLIDICLNKNSRDNMTVILITFPSTPQPTEEAVKGHQKALEKLREEIPKRLREMKEAAMNPLDLEQGQVLQEIAAEFPDNNEIYLLKDFICTETEKLCREKFGIDNNSFSREDSDPGSFSGQAFDLPQSLVATIGDDPLQDQPFGDAHAMDVNPSMPPGDSLHHSFDRSPSEDGPSDSDDNKTMDS